MKTPTRTTNAAPATQIASHKHPPYITGIYHCSAADMLQGSDLIYVALKLTMTGGVVGVGTL